VCPGSIDRRFVQTKRIPSKQRKPSSRETAKHRIRRNRTGRKHQVRLDEVIQQIEENREDAEASGQARESRRNPVDVSMETCPRKPEDSDSKAETSDHDGRKPPLWDRDVVVRGEFAVVAGRDGDHEDGGEELACWVRIGLMLSVRAHLPPIMPRNGS
jgi:hypothetical protein